MVYPYREQTAALALLLQAGAWVTITGSIVNFLLEYEIRTVCNTIKDLLCNIKYNPNTGKTEKWF